MAALTLLTLVAYFWGVDLAKNWSSGKPDIITSSWSNPLSSLFEILQRVSHQQPMKRHKLMLPFHIDLVNMNSKNLSTAVFITPADGSELLPDEGVLYWKMQGVYA